MLIGVANTQSVLTCSPIANCWSRTLNQAHLNLKICWYKNGLVQGIVGMKPGFYHIFIDIPHQLCFLFCSFSSFVSFSNPSRGRVWAVNCELFEVETLQHASANRHPSPCITNHHLGQRPDFFLHKHGEIHRGNPSI